MARTFTNEFQDIRTELVQQFQKLEVQLETLKEDAKIAINNRNSAQQELSALRENMRYRGAMNYFTKTGNQFRSRPFRQPRMFSSQGNL